MVKELEKDDGDRLCLDEEAVGAAVGTGAAEGAEDGALGVFLQRTSNTLPKWPSPITDRGSKSCEVLNVTTDQGTFKEARGVTEVVAVSK